MTRTRAWRSSCSTRRTTASGSPPSPPSRDFFSGPLGRWARLVLQLLDRPSQEPGHVHLGDPEPLADLRLREVAAEAQREDLALALGQAAHEPADGDGLVG